MKPRFFNLAAALVLSGWAFAGCLQSVGGGADAPDEGGARTLVADAGPIEPKADPRTVDRPNLIANARLRHGEDYAEILSKMEPVSYPILASPQQITLRFQLDLNQSFQLPVDGQPASAIWEPADERVQVRLVYVPQGKPANEASYCDGTWEVADDGSLVLVFPNLTVGEGELNFLLYYFTHFDEKDSKVPAKTPDFHEGDLLPLGSANPFPVGAEEGSIYPLGTFEVVRMAVKKPAFMPLKEKTLVPKEP